MFWFMSWMIALSIYERGAAEPTDIMKPAGWSGNFWGPAAAKARLTGDLPPLPISPSMARWDNWGRAALRDGDIIFRLGDARTLLGCFPLSLFIAEATGSVYSHTGIVAIEDGAAMVYDSSSAGIQRQPLSVWMLDCLGPVGVKRLKPAHRQKVPGILGFCRDLYQKQAPFDFNFLIDDRGYYCVEMTEKAYRSQGLALSEPVKIGDWENLIRYPFTAVAFLKFSGFALEQPISLEQPVYVPGNDHQGIWGSPLLDTVYPRPKQRSKEATAKNPGGLDLKGDLEVTLFMFGELRRSYRELPYRLFGEVAPRLSAPATESVAATDSPSSGPSGETTATPNLAPRGQ